VLGLHEAVVEHGFYGGAASGKCAEGVKLRKDVYTPQVGMVWCRGQEGLKRHLVVYIGVIALGRAGVLGFAPLVTEPVYGSITAVFFFLLYFSALLFFFLFRILRSINPYRNKIIFLKDYAHVIMTVQSCYIIFQKITTSKEIFQKKLQNSSMH
jgi:hypothetical protein